MRVRNGLAILIAFFANTLSGVALAADPPRSINDVIKCKPIGSENCPYWTQLYRGDAGFKQAINALFKQGKVQDIDGPEKPLAPHMVGGELYIAGWKCENQNCGMNQVYVLYSVSQKKAVGFYKPEGESPRWIGNPNTEERKKLTELSQ